jgi:hypothetical protein
MHRDDNIIAKNVIEEAWGGIDVALKGRFNLISNSMRSQQ